VLQTSAQDKKVIKKYGALPYNGKGYIINKSYKYGSIPVDTLKFENGTATLTQDKYDGDIGWIYLTDVDRNMVHYMIYEKGTITFTATKDSMIFVTGTPNNDAFYALDQELEPLRRKMKVGQRQFAALDTIKDKVKTDALRKEIIATADLWWAKQMKFATDNRNMAGFNYVTKCFSRFSSDEVKQILENYKGFAEKTAYISLKKRYETELTTNTGVKPPDFTLPTPAGDMIALSSIRKKAVIVDFWASWCKPCRAENPNMIALYNKYKEKGLEIISVSIDAVKDKDKWIEAIKTDGITWLQVWDDKGETNKAYGITAIPRTYLLDEKGNVVVKDLRGEELNKAVEKLLGDKTN
jgi:peroxiredoxin